MRRIKVAFGKPIVQHSVWEERIAEARSEIEMARHDRGFVAGVHESVAIRVLRREAGGAGSASFRIGLADDNGLVLEFGE